jgi:hypothetical protein
VTKRLWEIGDIVDVQRLWKMPSAIYDPKHWRERAEETRILADQIHDSEAKRIMLDIAERYERMAKRYERMAKRAEARAKKPPTPPCLNCVS